MTHASPELLLSFRNNLRSCTRCPISSNQGGPIPWSGDPHPTYAILGEAPGRTEAYTGEPFVGDSGNILRHWLKQVGIDARKVAFANSVCCWPNRNPATPSAEEMSNCRPWTNGQLEIIRPKILITMGVVAFKQIRQVKWPALKDIHGIPYRHPVHGYTIVSTYHPASYLRGKNKRYEEKITTDLATAASWDGHYPEECCMCGDAFYRYDPDWALAFCERHSARQGLLFPEDIGVTT